MNTQEKAAVIARGLVAMEGRADANETAAFARSLDVVETEMFEILYPELKGRKLVDVDTSINPGAKTFTYRTWDKFGMAKIVANGATDFPRVGLLGKEVTASLVSIGDSYGYSKDDLRHAAFMNLPLDTELAAAARTMIENKIDQMIATGDSEVNLTGLINNASVPVLTTTELVGDWIATATPAQILADMMLIVGKVSTQTKRTMKANTLLLPDLEFEHVSATIVNALTGETILASFLRTMRERGQPMTVESYEYLALADSAGTGPRAVAYQKDKRVVRFVIAQEFMQSAPQQNAFNFDIYCDARLGGAQWRNPLGGVYADDI